MKNFITYRNGSKDLTSRVKLAMTHFCRVVGVLPLGVVVNPKLKDDAAQVLTALALGSVPVITSGGCLTGEVWLQAPNEFDLDSLRGAV